MKYFKTEIKADKSKIEIICGYLVGRLGKDSFEILTTIDDFLVIVIKSDEDALAFKLSDLETALNEVIAHTREVSSLFKSIDDDFFRKFTEQLNKPKTSPYNNDWLYRPITGGCTGGSGGSVGLSTNGYTTTADGLYDDDLPF